MSYIRENLTLWSIVITENRNNYVTYRNREIAKEEGKIIGADYMLQRLLDVLETEVEKQEAEI